MLPQTVLPCSQNEKSNRNSYAPHSTLTQFPQFARNVRDNFTLQGSAVGPVAYVINTGDLVAVTPVNRICKYADDAYVIVPAANSHTRNVEVANTEQWATTNNLTLNQIKSVEIIFTEKHRFRVSHHPTLPGIRRVTTLKMLGVTLTNHMSASEHVSDIISRCAQSIHAVRTLRCHGMSDDALQVIYT